MAGRLRSRPARGYLAVAPHWRETHCTFRPPPQSTACLPARPSCSYALHNRHGVGRRRYQSRHNPPRGIVAASIFVFLESLDEFTGTFFVGAPDVTTLPLLLNNASMSGNYQVSSITALILLAPSLLFMVVIHKFMRPEMMAKLGT